MTEKITLEVLAKGLGDTGTSRTSGSSKGGMFGGLLAAGGKIGIIAGAVMSILSLAKDMFWSFKPVLSIISSLAKMIGMFLQPIAETFTYLLVPILTLLRPIVQAFNTMLAPFMDLIRELSVMANQQAASGDITGLMQTSSLMLQILFEPFFIAMSDVIGTMLFDMADSIGTLLINAIYGISILIASVVDSIFKTDLVSTLEENKQITLDTLHSGIDILQNNLHEGTSTMLSNLYISMFTEVEQLGASLPNLMEVNIVQPFEDLVRRLGDVVKNKKRIPSIDESYAILSNRQQSSMPEGYNYQITTFDPTAPGGILNPI